jgi:hypothetical protein
MLQTIAAIVTVEQHQALAALAPAPPAPAAPMQKPGGQEISAEDPEQPLVSVAIQFPWLDHWW